MYASNRVLLDFEFSLNAGHATKLPASEGVYDFSVIFVVFFIEANCMKFRESKCGAVNSTMKKETSTCFDQVN